MGNSTRHETLSNKFKSRTKNTTKARKVHDAIGGNINPGRRGSAKSCLVVNDNKSAAINKINTPKREINPVLHSEAGSETHTHRTENIDLVVPLTSGTPPTTVVHNICAEDFELELNASCGAGSALHGVAGMTPSPDAAGADYFHVQYPNTRYHNEDPASSSDPPMKPGQGRFFFNGSSVGSIGDRASENEPPDGAVGEEPVFDSGLKRGTDEEDSRVVLEEAFQVIESHIQQEKLAELNAALSMSEASSVGKTETDVIPSDLSSSFGNNPNTALVHHPGLHNASTANFSVYGPEFSIPSLPLIKDEPCEENEHLAMADNNCYGDGIADLLQLQMTRPTMIEGTPREPLGLSFDAGFDSDTPWPYGYDGGYLTPVQESPELAEQVEETSGNIKGVDLGNSRGFRTFTNAFVKNSQDSEFFAVDRISGYSVGNLSQSLPPSGSDPNPMWDYYDCCFDPSWPEWNYDHNPWFGQDQFRYHESVDTDSAPSRWPLTAPWPPNGPGACPPSSTLAPHTGYTSGGPLHHQQSSNSFHHRHSEHDASTSDGQLPHHIYSSSPSPGNPLLNRPIGSQTQYRRPPQHSLSTASRSEATRGGEYLYRLPHNPPLSSSPPHQSLMAELIGTGQSDGEGVSGGPQDLPPTEEEGGAASLGSKDGPHAARSKLERLCGVCGDRALGYNFNAITCESCKAFFRRNALKNKNLKCPFQDNCTVDTVTRRFCQKCRLTKCFDIGMKKEWIMTDEEKQKKKLKIEANKIRKFGGGSDLHGRSRSADSSEDSMSFTMSPGVRKVDLALSPVGSPRSSSRQREAEFTPAAGTESKGHPFFLPTCSAGVSVASGASDQACQKLKDQQMLKEKYMKTTPVPSVLPLQESVGKSLHHETSINANSGLKPQAIVRGMVRDPETCAPKVQRLLNQTDVHDTGHTNLNLTAPFSTSTTSSLPDLVSQASPHNFLPPYLTSSTPSPEHGDNPSNDETDVSGVMVNRSGDSNIGPTLMSRAVDAVAPQPHGLSSKTVSQSSIHYSHNNAVLTNSSQILDPLLEAEISSSNSAERLVLPDHSSDVDSALLDGVHSNSLSRNESPADLFKLVASACSTSVADSSPSSFLVDSRISSTTAPVQVTDAEHRVSPDGICGAEAMLTGSGEAVPQTSSSSTLTSNNCSTYPSSASGRTDSFEEVAEFNRLSTNHGSQPEDRRNLHDLENGNCINSGSGHRGAPFVGVLRPTEHSQQPYQERLDTQPQRPYGNRLGTGGEPSSDDGPGKHFPPPWLATPAQAQQQTTSNKASPLNGDRSATKNSTPTGRNYIKEEPGEAAGEPTDQTTSCSAALDLAGSTGDDWSDFRVLDALQIIQGGQAGDGDTSSVVDSIVNTAVQAEYCPESLLVGATVEQSQPSHRRGCRSPLTPIEQRKLDELHTANASMMAPLSEDLAYKNQHNPSLINVINMTDIAIRRLIQMSKQLEAFSCLCTEDQIALLKGSCTEMMILRSVFAYDADKDSWKIPEHHDTYKSIKLKVLKAAPGNVHVYEEHKRFILAFQPEWRHDPNIMLLLSAITLFTPSRPNVRHPKAIQHEQCCYLLLLKRYLECALGGCEGRTVYAGLLERINDLRRLNENHLKVYMQVNPEEVQPLLIEIFDLQQR